MTSNEALCKLLEVDLKVLTFDNKEVTLRYTDFKNCKDVTIEYDYYDGYDAIYYSLRSPVLKGIKITIPCNGYSVEVISE